MPTKRCKTSPLPREYHKNIILVSFINTYNICVFIYNWYLCVIPAKGRMVISPKGMVVIMEVEIFVDEMRKPL